MNWLQHSYVTCRSVSGHCTWRLFAVPSIGGFIPDTLVSLSPRSPLSAKITSRWKHFPTKKKKQLTNQPSDRILHTYTPLQHTHTLSFSLSVMLTLWLAWYLSSYTKAAFLYKEIRGTKSLDLLQNTTPSTSLGSALSFSFFSLSHSHRLYANCL